MNLAHTHLEQDIPNRLTLNRAKATRFSHEAYFQEAYFEYSALVGAAHVPQRLHHRTYVLFKPDAGATRCVARCLAVLAELEMYPVWSTVLQISRHSFRELWRYELNVSTYHRYPAVDALLCTHPSLFIMFERPAASADAECLSRKIDSAKGPSQRRLRSPESIRARIDAGDGVLNHIHTPEEPIDMLREIGVLFDPKTRHELFSVIAGDQAPRHAPAIEAFYAAVPPHPLDPAAVKSRLFPRESDQEFEGLLKSAAEATDFDRFYRSLADRRPQLSHWDAITLFVTQRNFVVDGVTPILEFERHRLGY